jgi:excinuclease ABC subunit C
MVVFEQGEPKKSRYRKFKIRTVAGANDVASIQEVLRRRFKRAAEAAGEVLSSEFSVMSSTYPPQGADAQDEQQRIEDEAQAARYDAETIQNSKFKTQNSEEDTWAELPDLILIDGGVGQLNGALEVLRELRFDHIPTAGVVKGPNRDRFDLLLPGASDLIVLDRSSPALRLIQTIDEEADRFAKHYHRGLRSKSAFTSTLDEIPGIGPKRKRALLKAFGSLDGIRAASVEELAAVPGMTRKSAEEIKGLL